MIKRHGHTFQVPQACFAALKLLMGNGNGKGRQRETSDIDLPTYIVVVATLP